MCVSVSVAGSHRSLQDVHPLVLQRSSQRHQSQRGPRGRHEDRSEQQTVLTPLQLGRYVPSAILTSYQGFFASMSAQTGKNTSINFKTQNIGFFIIEAVY